MLQVESKFFATKEHIKEFKYYWSIFLVKICGEGRECRNISMWLLGVVIKGTKCCNSSKFTILIECIANWTKNSISISIWLLTIHSTFKAFVAKYRKKYTQIEWKVLWSKWLKVEYFIAIKLLVLNIGDHCKLQMVHLHYF